MKLPLPRPLFAASLLFGAVLALGILHAEDADRPTGPAPAASPGPLSETECNALMERELESLTAMIDGPLSPALRAARMQILSEPGRSEYLRQCRLQYTRHFYECRMAASGLAAMLSCQQIDQAEAANGDAGAAAAGGDMSAGSQNGGSSAPLPGVEAVESVSVPVTDASCARAYEHMLQVALQSPGFASREDQQSLRQSWESAPARESFRRRCRARFQPADLGCILHNSDPDVVQACLLVIPADEPG
ncbi:MAG: hypothetical protein K1X75_01305 [Leptospirales bacterium]|nr:hypothetical protein [Leptospirales bacterium]